MRQKSHVRFLGGKESVMTPIYPPVTHKWRKMGGTPRSKRQVVCKHCWPLSVLMFVARPGNSKSLKASIMLIKWNTVNPTNPAKDRKGREEDIGKSESRSVMERIKSSTEKQIKSSTENHEKKNSLITSFFYFYEKGKCLRS